MPITTLPPLALYIHTPWCVQKCPYCDFNSHTLKQSIPEREYIDRLLFDLESEMPSVWGRQLSSIFIGGGTPSLLSPESYDRLLSGIRALLPFYADIEITMEANPGTVEAEKFAGFFAAGINRISIGVQSFNDKYLSTLGRIHSANEAEKAFQIARNAGFKNINVDLMYALPQQTLDQAMQDLNQAIALQPEHISWYQLTLEPNTLFYNQPPTLPEDELICDMADAGIELLAQNDYQQYEVSAYSRGGNYRSQHNLNYWQFGDYLGIGAGAHGKITRADKNSITRISKRRSPKDYLNSEKPIIDRQRELTLDELPLEFMMNVMRLKQGVPQSLFFETTGLALNQISDVLRQVEQAGLISLKDQKIAPSEQGYRFVNETLAYFMPENFKHFSGLKNIKIKEIT
ncbi:radical SAM family heme chaperone HemW [Aliikangiella sp. IMCC44632]